MPGVKKAPSKGADLSVQAYTISGEEKGILSLPKEIFGGKVNKKLLTHAMRVYTTNGKTLTGSTKTRGQVRGSTVKIYNQKGTGRARHGGIRAPIFVGGGIVFGPTPRRVILDLPRKMKKAALVSALAARALDKNALGLVDAEKFSGKTREVVNFLQKIMKDAKKPKSTLIVTGAKMDNVLRSVKNIPNVTTLPVNLINAYEVIKHEVLILTQDAIEKLESRINNIESIDEEKTKAVKEKAK